MVEESKKRLLAKGVNDNKISIVSNTPVLERFQKARKTFPGTIKQHQGKLILLYVGFLNFSRGLDMVIKSLNHLKNINKDFFLVMLGTGTAEEYLNKLVVKLALDDYVAFEGWIDNKIVPEYISSSDICIVPHYKCNHWDNTIPNKLFDYMATGKPVLVSDVTPMKRIVKETNCGLVYENKNIASFVDQLKKLQDDNYRMVLGQNGMNAIKKFYNWNHDSQRMWESINKVLN
jgi:glycosyltransferase involved in cell wall biosynthesis